MGNPVRQPRTAAASEPTWCRPPGPLRRKRQPTGPSLLLATLSLPSRQRRNVVHASSLTFHRGGTRVRLDADRREHDGAGCLMLVRLGQRATLRFSRNCGRGAVGTEKSARKDGSTQTACAPSKRDGTGCRRRDLSPSGARPQPRAFISDTRWTDTTGRQGLSDSPIAAYPGDWAMPTWTTIGAGTRRSSKNGAGKLGRSAGGEGLHPETTRPQHPDDASGTARGQVRCWRPGRRRDGDHVRPQ